MIYRRKIQNQGAGLPPLFKGCDKPHPPAGEKIIQIKNYRNLKISLSLKLPKWFKERK
jgi:hypothetical protein